MPTCWKESEAVDNIWMGLALGVLLMCVVVFIMLRVQILIPLKRLQKMTEHMKELEARELQHQAENVSGMPGEVARAIAAYVESAKGSEAEEQLLNPVAEEFYKMHVVDEICRSLLPMPLKENSASANFSLTGDLQDGVRRNCAFYDYFYLDENRMSEYAGYMDKILSVILNREDFFEFIIIYF